MAPEVVKQVAYTKKADIWSVGCLIVEMLTGEHPWAQLNQMQAIFKVIRASYHSITFFLFCLWRLTDVSLADRFFQRETPDTL
jgi:serine/threonine protein kinase